MTMSSPLVAAIAMSLSSILIVANAPRLDYGAQTRTRRAGFAGRSNASFIWILKNGQYDDLEGAAQRILFEDHDARLPRW